MRYFRRANRGGHILVIEQNALGAVFGAQVNARFARQGDKIFIVSLERDTSSQRFERERAVHCAGVHVHVAEHLGDAARERAFARAYRTVNRDDQFFQEAAFGRSADFIFA